jgi:hypothetical protein
VRNRAALNILMDDAESLLWEDGMMELIKMAALGAVFSYSAVIAYNQPVRRLEAALSAKSTDHARVLTSVPQMRVAQH